MAAPVAVLTAQILVLPTILLKLPPIYATSFSMSMESTHPEVEVLAGLQDVSVKVFKSKQAKCLRA